MESSDIRPRPCPNGARSHCCNARWGWGSRLCLRVITWLFVGLCGVGSLVLSFAVFSVLGSNPGAHACLSSTLPPSCVRSPCALVPVDELCQLRYGHSRARFPSLWRQALVEVASSACHWLLEGGGLPREFSELGARRSPPLEGDGAWGGYEMEWGGVGWGEVGWSGVGWGGAGRGGAAGG